MINNNHDFGKKLKELRMDSGYTQAKLAALMETTLKTVSHWETNYSEPSINQLIKLADLFGITVDELIRA